MNNDELAQRLLATFIGELDDQVRSMNADLLELEKDPMDAERLRSLFRSSHTIKGAARVAGVGIVEDVCNALESLFSDVRDGNVQLTGSDFARLFVAVDGLSDAGAALRKNEPVVEGVLRKLIPQLTTRAHGVPDIALPPAAPLSTVAPTRLPPVEPAPAPAAAPELADAPTPDTATSDAPDASSATASRDFVRIPAERLDDLLSRVTELVQAAARMKTLLNKEDPAIRRASRELEQTVAGVTNLTHRLRLRSFRDAVESLPRAVRDVAAATGREIDLVIEGADVEVDRIVTDALREPMLHLVRNAVDHGVETPAARRQAGKPERGTVRVSAEIARGALRVIVEDDGAGVDETAVRAALAAAGRPVANDARGLARVLMEGGLSSRDDATTISGRGVGLDLVRNAVETLGGRVDMTWRKGQGTRFVLEMPPRPAALRVLAVRSGGVHLAIPTHAIDRLRLVRPVDVNIVEGRATVKSAVGYAPLASLATLLGPPLQARTLEGRMPALVLRHENDAAIIMVDEFGIETDIVLRPIPVARGRFGATMGAALLPDGSVAIVLDPATLVTGAYDLRAAPSMITPGAKTVRRILVVDDSITTRTLEQGVLETAGYHVTTAVDGFDAWQKLQELDDVDLIVADIEMPNLDGFGLVERIRSSRRFTETPVVLVTGRESDADRRRGLELGADAYLGKSSFDQVVLLQTVHQLIGDA